MNRKIIKVISVIQLVLCIVSYFSFSKHFDNDDIVFDLLANTELAATLLRLSLYVIPGIHLLSGLYGLVFSQKSALLIISIVELISCAITFVFVGNSQYILILSIIALSLSILYLFNVIISKD